MSDQRGRIVPLAALGSAVVRHPEERLAFVPSAGRHMSLKLSGMALENPNGVLVREVVARSANWLRAGDLGCLSVRAGKELEKQL